MGYCLMVAGLAVALGGVVVAALANVPGDRGEISDRWNAPDGWLTWLAIGFAVAWLGWALAAAFAESLRLRIWSSAAMAAGCAAGLLVVVVRMPGRGIDLSFPLTALGLALGLVGAMAVLVANLPRLVGDPDDRYLVPGTARLAVRGGSVVVAAALSVGLAVGVVPGWVVAANTEATTAGTPAADWRSTVDGPVAWRVSDVPGDAQLVGTAGGVAVLDWGSVRMLDAASGRQRWSYRRWDVDAKVSQLGLNSFTVSPDGRWLAMSYQLDAPRRRYVDDRRVRDRLWVFDTPSGRVRADIPVPAKADLLAVDGDRVLVSAPGEEGVTAAGRVLVAVDLDGEVRWRHPLDHGCGPAQASVVDSDLLALVRCAEGHSLVRLDRKTGAARWTWRAGQVSGDPADFGHRERHQDVVLAVAGDTAVVDIRVTYQTRKYDGNGAVESAAVWHNLVGVRLADGRPAWERRDQHYGVLPDSPPPGAGGTLHASGGTAVLTVQHQAGEGRTARQTIALRAFDAATGAPSWSVDLPDSASSAPVRRDAIGLLPDGRLVLAYRDLPAQGTPDFCVVGAWDVATGQQRAQVRLRRTAPEAAAGSRCDGASIVEVRDGVALLVPERGLLMLH